MGMFELIKALADGKVDYVLVGGLAAASPADVTGAPAKRMPPEPAPDWV